MKDVGHHDAVGQVTSFDAGAAELDEELDGVADEVGTHWAADPARQMTGEYLRGDDVAQCPSQSRGDGYLPVAAVAAKLRCRRYSGGWERVKQLGQRFAWRGTG